MSVKLHTAAIDVHGAASVGHIPGNIRLAVQFQNIFLLRTQILAVAQCVVVGSNLAAQCQHETKEIFGNRVGISARRVDQGDLCFGGSLPVYIHGGTPAAAQ